MQAAGPKRLMKKPGRPARPADPDQFGPELTFAQLGKCLGMSRYRAKILVVDNAVPTIARGRTQTIHRAVAQQIVSGAWWTQRAAAQV